MIVSTPQYLLFSESDSRCDSGRWRFMLRRIGSPDQFQVADEEPGVRGERLNLLTVVRALESLDQPSEVTIVACSRYVRQGVQYGLSDWKHNGWRWEFFGQMVPVKNGDLWQRMERAMRFHRVRCRRHGVDVPPGPAPGSSLIVAERGERESGRFGGRVAALHGLRCGMKRWAAARRWFAAKGRLWRQRALHWQRTRVCRLAGQVVVGNDRW